MKLDSVEILLITSSEAGVLSLIMRKLASKGLMYEKKISTPNGEFSHLNINALGKLKCSQEELAISLEEVSGIEMVLKIKSVSETYIREEVIVKDSVDTMKPFENSESDALETCFIRSEPQIEFESAQPKLEVKPSPSLAEEINDSASLPMFINAGDELNPQIIEVAINQLSRVYEPIAELLVDQAVADSENAGELFSLLAEEFVDVEERILFLSVIKLNKDTLSPA